MPADRLEAGRCERALPETYGETALCRRLRACERFGMEPRRFAALSLDEQELLLRFDELRRAEEARIQSAAAAALAARR